MTMFIHVKKSAPSALLFPPQKATSLPVVFSIKYAHDFVVRCLVMCVLSLFSMFMQCIYPYLPGRSTGTAFLQVIMKG